MMYDLSNLNDYEFELLCKDIMERKLGQEFVTFSRGRDGGIDISDMERSPKIVIQVKHYVRSNFSSLKRSLTDEIPKITKMNLEKYFVCTSMSLSRENKKKICDIFLELMEDISYVIAKEDIDDFLADESNQDIVKKHYKLWLCASNILSLIQNREVLIDCDELMMDIGEQIPFFVETESYREAKSKLDKERIIFLVGSPGVGKTTISKMLLLKCVEDGYVVRFTSTNNIGEIKAALSFDPNKKEVIFLDDFLGQHYLNLQESRPGELKSLLSFVARSPHKKVILNSRVTILNEATTKYYDFLTLMERYDSNKYLIDMDKTNLLDKGQILYNHIYFNEIPDEYFESIKKGKKYLEFVKHKNYNPRIIEFVTKKRIYSTVEPRGYSNLILQHLNNPHMIWENEFNYRMSDIDRIFMNVFYSLSSGVIDVEALKEAFDARLRYDSQGIDTSKNQFEEVLRRLSNSVIKRTEKGYSVLNPSVNDYLMSSIANNEPEQAKIVSSALFVDQLKRVAIGNSAKQIMKKRLLAENDLDIKMIVVSPTDFYLQFIITNKIFQEDQKHKIQEIVKNFKVQKMLFPFMTMNLIEKIFEDKFLSYYKLNDVIDTKEFINKVSNHLDYDTFGRFFELYNTKIGMTEWSKELFEKIFFEKIEGKVREEIGEKIYDFMDEYDEEEDNGEFLKQYIDQTSSDLYCQYMTDVNGEYGLCGQDYFSTNINASDYDLDQMRAEFARREEMADYDDPDRDDTEMLEKLVEMFGEEEEKEEVGVF